MEGRGGGKGWREGVGVGEEGVRVEGGCGWREGVGMLFIEGVGMLFIGRGGGGGVDGGRG